MLYNDVSYTMLYNFIQCCIMLYNLYNVTQWCILFYNGVYVYMFVSCYI